MSQTAQQTASSPQPSHTTPTPRKAAGRPFTPATARAASALATAAKRRRALDARSTSATLPSGPLALHPDPVAAELLAQTRAHLEHVRRLIPRTIAPDQLDRLASAWSKLAEVERKLAGRPDPGRLAPKPPARRPAAAPLILELAPAPQPTPQPPAPQPDTPPPG